MSKNKTRQGVAPSPGSRAGEPAQVVQRRGNMASVLRLNKRSVEDDLAKELLEVADRGSSQPAAQRHDGLPRYVATPTALQIAGWLEMTRQLGGLGGLR